jgi:hypothetical protein
MEEDMNHRLTATERRAIRAYAARTEGMQPRQINIEVGVRYNLKSGTPSTNVYLVDDTPDWDESDLHDFEQFSAGYSVPLTREGQALIDFYIYRNDRDRELLTNVQAYFETVDGRVQMVKLDATGSHAVTGDALRAFA